MRIEEYPRPHEDSAIGFHYFPQADHFGRSDADRWVPRLENLGASWLVMPTPPSRPVPDHFLQRLMVADIEPVVAIKPQRIGLLDQRVLRGTLRSLADSGVHYVVLFDRPNERTSWAPQDWAKPALVERFVDCLAPALELAAAENLIPVLPPMEPFGAYWDTVFLQTMLKSLQRRGLAPLLERAAVGMRNFANDRPLDWGRGGQAAWPQAKPYVKEPGGENHRGFRLYEWYQAIIQDLLGHEMPLIACANGPQESRMEGRGVDPRVHAGRVVEMTRRAIKGELPDAVFNHAFWLLSAERNQFGYEERWFEPDGSSRLPAVAALAAIGEQKLQRAKGGTTFRSPQPAVLPDHASQPVKTALPGAKANGRKPISHYLLLPRFEWGATRWHIDIVGDYVEAFLPTCGFSVEEAKLAWRVTIIGNEQGVSAADAQDLVAAGCQVERIAGSSGEETQEMLLQLARNRQHSGAD